MGVRNNYPEIVQELTLNSNRRWQRQQFRERYGDAGDEMRRRGYGIATIGPKTREAIKYFGEKLGKALYYKHIGRRLEGTLLCNSIYVDRNPEFLDTLLNMAPVNAELIRESKNLNDQFFYRFNYNAELGVFFAVVAFKEQLGYNILAMEQKFYDAFKATQPNIEEMLKDVFNQKF